MLGFVIT